jgi:hypothetical protein
MLLHFTSFSLLAPISLCMFTLAFFCNVPGFERPIC